MATSDDHALLLQLSADIKGLEKSFDKAAGTVKSRSKQMTNDATSLEKFFGKPSLAKALDKTFDATRFKILDSGVARVGIMGGALESLGASGLIAAAGVGAVAAAFVGAREAAKFADDINDTAKKLHVTSDALQEYRYAIRAAGGEEKGADDALESFSVNLGKAQEGLKKSQRAFLALGFTKEQIKGFTDADTALKAVTERISGLPSQQKDAIIDQLGLTGLKPLIEDGATAMQHLRDEAHKLGLVMDADLVKRGGDLNDEFETVAKVINVQLKSALVDLGPILLGLLQKMADMAKVAADVADAFRSIEDKRTSKLADLRQQFNDRAASPATLLYGGPAKDRERAARALGELIRRTVGPDGAAKRVTATHTLKDQSKVAAGPKDDTAQRKDQADATLAAAERGLLQAQLALTDNVQARAKIEKDIADQELAQALAQLEKQKADIADDKGISPATKKRLAAEIDLAEAAQQQAALAKKALIDRDAARQDDDRYFATQKEIGGYFDTMASIAASQADTARERLAIELKALDAQQRIERSLQVEALRRQVQDGALSQSGADALLRSADEARAAQRGNVVFNGASPLEKYARSVRDLDTEIQNAGVVAFQGLASGLADAIVNAKSLGDVVKNVFLQMAQDILKSTLEKNITGPLANFASNFVGSLFKVPGHAAGTDFAPGGLSLVGEKGPELVNLPRGSQVIPNSTLKALRSLAPPGYGGARGAANGVRGGDMYSFNFNGPVNDPRQVQLSAQQAATRMARIVGRGQRGV